MNKKILGVLASNVCKRCVFRSSCNYLKHDLYCEEYDAIYELAERAKMSVRSFANSVNSGSHYTSDRITTLEINQIKRRKREDKKYKTATEKQLQYLEVLKGRYEILGLKLPLEYERRHRNQVAAHQAISLMLTEINKADALRKRIYGDKWDLKKGGFVDD